MPDLTAVNRFHREMVKIEQDFIKEALQLYAAFRRDALDITDAVGLASPQLSSIIRTRLNLLAVQIRELAMDYVQRFNQTTAGYARRSLIILRDVEPNLPPVDQLVVSDLQQPVVSDFLASVTNFIEVIAGRFIVALDEARQSVDDPQAVQRVFSPELIDGRASAYRHGVNTLRYESQRKIWTVGIALAAVYFLRAKEQSGVRLQKQAVATIDKRTTKCCLNVHGQIKDIDEPFELSGEPCGGQKQHPPFPGHQCRTVESPYLPALEKTGLTTDEMRESALAELSARNR